MKNVCLVIRDGYDAKYIISKLNRRNEVRYSYIIEKGGKARAKKIRRMVRINNVFGAFVNIFILLIYNYIMQKRMKKICGHQEYPKNCRYIYVNDVNDVECRNAVKKICPELILVYGTGILSDETIESFGDNIYNIHSSILPYYRNVHSDFWAYVDGRKDLIGITIFKLDCGIDTGKIACQKKCELPMEAKLHEYKAQNLTNIPKIVERFIHDFFEGNIILESQNPMEGSMSSTPRAKDLISFLKMEGTI